MRPNHRTSTLFPYTTLFRSKNLAECAIDFLNPTVGRNRDHTVGNAFQNRFGEASASLQLTAVGLEDRKSTRLNSSHRCISYAVFCLKKKKRASRARPAGSHR